MTGDELERAIDFILKSQARAEARIERNEELLSRNEELLSRNEELLSRNEELLSRLAEQSSQQRADCQKRHEAIEDAHANLVRVLTQNMQTQDIINKSLRETDVRQARLSASLGEMLRASEESRRTSEESRRASEESLRAAMTALATTQEKTEATVDRLSQKVEALVKIVEEERDGGH